MSSSPSARLDSRDRETILRNVFQQTKNMRTWRGLYLWSWVGAMTGFGSGYSWEVCKQLGWDPEMTITPHAQLPDRRAPPQDARR